VAVEVDGVLLSLTAAVVAVRVATGLLFLVSLRVAEPPLKHRFFALWVLLTLLRLAMGETEEIRPLLEQVVVILFFQPLLLLVAVVVEVLLLV
jgi:hypothetical protein